MGKNPWVGLVFDLSRPGRVHDKRVKREENNEAKGFIQNSF